MSFVLLLAALVAGGWYTVVLCVLTLLLILYSHIRSKSKQSLIDKENSGGKNG